jgi:hypothetical protein
MQTDGRLEGAALNQRYTSETAGTGEPFPYDSPGSGSTPQTTTTGGTLPELTGKGNRTVPDLELTS